MLPNQIKYFILTGEPGVGKTTLTKQLSNALSEKGVKTAGFITEEVRENKIRQGFDVVAHNGTRGRLARDQRLVDVPTKCSVGKYCVFVTDFEKVALSSLNLTGDGQKCFIIDEIGKMEFFSTLFKAKVKELFNEKSKEFVLATIPIRKGDQIIEFIRNHRQAKIWTVTRENRNTLYGEILKEMQMVMNIK